MSFVAAGIAAAGGIAQIIASQKGKAARKKEQEEANAELAQRKQAYEDMEFSNPYANLENVFEDLTVNTQQADMMNQQTQQAQANAMQSLQAAAGGSGIAGLAQQLMQSGQLERQKAAADIGKQEQANQQAMMSEASRLQQLEARGEESLRKFEKDKIETLFGMSQQRKISADAARQRATDQLMAGIGSTIGGGVGIGVGIYDRNKKKKAAAEGDGES
tara:strand:+ start:34 stop:687 length:654 start_codon:yes stop_codon:yes gene_type:complete